MREHAKRAREQRANEPEEPDRPPVPMVGEDGNAFAILGRCRRAARRAGWSDQRWEAFREEATGGDYDHLLATVMEHFDAE